VGRRHRARPIGPCNGEVVSLMSDATSIDSARDRRWLVLGVIGLAQLMVVLGLLAVFMPLSVWRYRRIS